MTNNIETMEKIVEEVSQLRDLFVRRLMTDKAKTEIYSALLEQNASLNKQIERRNIESLFKEFLLICDRIKASEEQSDFLDSICEEIMEVFARWEVVPTEIPIDLIQQFNPKYQKVVETVMANDEYPHGTVVSVKRKGYFLCDRLLRPEEVVVAINQQEDADL